MPSGVSCDLVVISEEGGVGDGNLLQSKTQIRDRKAHWSTAVHDADAVAIEVQGRAAVAAAEDGSPFLEAAGRLAFHTFFLSIIRISISLRYGFAGIPIRGLFLHVKRRRSGGTLDELGLVSL